MKRDMDLIREILLRFEASEKERNDLDVLADLGSKNVINAHLKLLEDSGFLDRLDVQMFPNGVTFMMGWRITSSGHDFLNSVRDPEIWRKTKTGASKLGAWSIKLLGDLASSYVRAKAQELGLPI